MASADGFKAFYLEWQRARNERAKWNKASAHAARMYTRKAHAIWVDVWHENRRNRHLTEFSLRSIRRNRCNRAFGIWCVEPSDESDPLPHPLYGSPLGEDMTSAGCHLTWLWLSNLRAYAWLMAKQDRQIVRSADLHRAHVRTLSAAPSW